jgi:hypothetical protein
MTITDNQIAQRAKRATTPIVVTPAALTSPTDDQHPRDIQTRPLVGGQPFDPDGNGSDDNHSRCAVGVDLSATDNHAHHDTHSGCVVGGEPSASHPTNVHTSPMVGSSDGWHELRVWAEMLDDAMRARIAATNRAERGGVEPIIYEAHLEALQRAEHACRLSLRRCFRRVAPPSIIEWQKNSNGIGIDLLARLLGHIGNPRWATPHHWEGIGASRVLITDPPFERTVGQLWQYAGHGAPGRKWKGMNADDLAAQGSPMIKMLVHLNSVACMKCMSSPYRLTYEAARLDVADKLHTVECVRCGPSGKPAQPDAPWSLGHQHAHALRIVGKEILRDLWRMMP